MAKSDREKNRITMAHARQEIAKEYKQRADELTSENIKYKKMLTEYQEENRYLRSQVASMNSRLEKFKNDPLSSLLGKTSLLTSLIDTVNIEDNADSYCKYTAKDGELRGLYIPDCNSDADDCIDYLSLRHYKFCPYCRRKIKIIEE